MTHSENHERGDAKCRQWEDISFATSGVASGFAVSSFIYHIAAGTLAGLTVAIPAAFCSGASCIAITNTYMINKENREAQRQLSQELEKCQKD